MSAAITIQTIPVVGNYQIDQARSRIDFTTTDMFGLRNVNGTFNVSEGAIGVKDPVQGTAVYAVADPASIKTDTPMRDAQVRSRLFLDVKRHPQMTFRSTSVTEADGTWRLSGVLNVKGADAPLELTITDISTTGGELRATATGTVDRFNHGVRAMPGMAGRRVQLTVTVVAQASPSVGIG